MADRDFKGIWIPKEVWLDERLNMLDKGILAEIDSLDRGADGCYASNEYLAKFCQCSTTKVSTSISKLIELGYLTVASFDGRNRHLKSRLSKNENQPFKNCKADFQNLKESNIEKKPKREYIPPAEFDEFWNLYPRKLSKQDAIKAWKALNPDADLVRRILDDLRRRAQRDWRNKDVKYIPYPATYIRGKRWEDEPVMGGEIEFADEYEREEYYKELWRRRLAEPGADTYEPPH